MRPDLTFLEQGELFAKKEILSGQGATGSESEKQQPAEVDDNAEDHN
jgi:hypothetical protein